MAHQQPRETSGSLARGDAEVRELLRGQRLMSALESFQRGDHVAGACELGAAAIRTKLTPPREGKDDEARQETEHDLGDDDADEIRRTAPVFGTEERLVDEVADDA